MLYYSTKDKSHKVSLKEAILKGLAPQNGLYMPERFARLDETFFQELPNANAKHTAIDVAKTLFGEDIPGHEIRKIAKRAINFDTPVVQLDENLYVLELWHGPTLAFKDVGARFMANTLSFLTKEHSGKIHVLVATSGDTGSAVANGFLNVPGIEVTLLYPSGMVSKIQEQQLTTLGNNITALEVDGVFDDCQRLVKTAFLDKELNEKLTLTSANSINLARFLPQSIYYFRAFGQVKDKNKPVVFSVPSGNYGNLTAGLIAKKMGLPVDQFVSANNVNNTVYEYLKSGDYSPRATVATLSNAMDVGAPNNFDRILDLHNGSHNEISKQIKGYYYNDEQTIEGIKEVYNKYKYVIDPHGAVGYLAMRDYLAENPGKTGIILETAHPAKFADIVNKALGFEIEMPKQLKNAMAKEKHSIKMSKEYEDFKQFLLNK